MNPLFFVESPGGQTYTKKAPESIPIILFLDKLYNTYILKWNSKQDFSIIFLHISIFFAKTQSEMQKMLAINGSIC